MKSETLEKLKKEAADALSRHICTLGVGSAQEALAMVQVLAALNGMTADEPSDVAKDVRRAYEDALLYGTGAYTMKYDAKGLHTDVAKLHLEAAMAEAPIQGYSAQEERPGPSAPCLHSVHGKGACWLPAGHKADHDFEGVGVVTPARPPKPCPVPGCTYAAGHNAPCNVPPLQPRPCTFERCVYSPGHGGKCSPIRGTVCPHDNVGCGVTRICEVCKGEPQEQRANVLSGRAMLLDGPMPTPAQVAHLRNEALEEAAVAMDQTGRLSGAAIIRAMKTTPKDADGQKWVGG